MPAAVEPIEAPSRVDWIVDGRSDLLLFLATPLLLVPAVGVLRWRLSVEEIATFVAAYGAIGHHLPGLLRAYGDRGLFSQFRLRFTLGPIFFVLVAVSYAHLQLDALKVISVVWGIWHGLAQVYGFCRIYDAKAGVDSRAGALLDRWMCVAWFVGGVLHSPERMAMILEQFYAAGGPIAPVETLRGFITVWDIATLAVTVAFCLNTWRVYQRGAGTSALKLAVLASGVGFWWFSLVFIDNAILGVALFEVFHDIQYLGITWVYSRRIVERGARVGPLTTFLFRPRAALVSIYVGLVLLYGALASFGLGLEAGALQRTALGLIAASGFLHFYYDGFIWKVREQHTREGLDVSSIDVRGPRAVSAASHVALFSLFAIPAVALGVAQYRGLVATPLVQLRALSQVAPKAPEVQRMFANALFSAGQLDAALAVYARVAALLPDDAGSRELIGDIHRRRGEWAAAGRSYAAAVERSNEDASALNKLGLTWSRRGLEERARAAWVRALVVDPAHANALANLGGSLISEDDGQRAEALLLRAVELDPQLAGAQANLALLYEARGDLARARRRFEAAEAIESHPVSRAGLERTAGQH